MSAEEDGDAGVIRTVTAPYRSHPVAEMNVVSMLYGLGLLMVLIPLLPFILLLWLFSKLGATE